MPLCQVCARLFDAFWTTKEDGIGIGIGLSISRSIVEASGGRIWAAPRSPCGAVFGVCLPVARSEAPMTLPLSEQRPVVYLIDDDASIRAALEDLFASVDLQVHAFGSSHDVLQADAPSCMVLDIRMPGQSGMEFHRQLREAGLHLPTIFITGHGDIAISVEAMKNGAIEFLTKPFRDQDLLDAIQHGIAGDRERRQREAALADLRGRWATLTAGEQEVTRLVV